MSWLIAYTAVAVTGIAIFNRLLPSEYQAKLKQRLVELWIDTQRPLDHTELKRRVLAAQRFPFRHIRFFIRSYFVIISLMSMTIICENVITDRAALTDEVSGLANLEAGLFVENPERSIDKQSCSRNALQTYFDRIDWQWRWKRYFDFRDNIRSMGINEVRLAFTIGTLVVLWVLALFAAMGLAISLRISREIMRVTNVVARNFPVFTVLQIAISIVVPIAVFHALSFTLAIFILSREFFESSALTGGPELISTIAAMIHSQILLFAFTIQPAGVGAGLTVSLFRDVLPSNIVYALVAPGAIAAFFVSITGFIADQFQAFWVAAYRTATLDLSTSYQSATFFWSFAIGLLIDVGYLASMSFIYACAKSPLVRGMLGRLLEIADGLPDGPLSLLEASGRALWRLFIGKGPE